MDSGRIVLADVIIPQKNARGTWTKVEMREGKKEREGRRVSTSTWQGLCQGMKEIL